MDQYNPFENSSHKVSKNPFEKGNKSSNMFEPTSNNNLETWDNYKKSEKQVKKYTKQNTINSSSINKIPKITINKPVINTQNKTKGGIIALIVCIVFSMMSFIDSTFEEDDDYTYDDPDEFVYELDGRDTACLEAVKNIENNSFSDFDVSEIIKKTEEYNINLNEMINKINDDGVYNITGTNYELDDPNHVLVYKQLYDYDVDGDLDYYYSLVFNIEGENINTIADNFNPESKGKIIGIELVISNSEYYNPIKDTVKCGNCEYEGKSLDKYLQEEISF